MLSTDAVRSTTRARASSALVRHPDHRSDLDLVRDVADEVATPRNDPADSFVLHAPLELAARAALLPFVEPSARPAARARIADIATQHRAFGPAAPAPDAREHESTEAAASALVRAISAGDLAATDAAAAALAHAATGEQLRRLLARTVIPSLSAAAHAPIFLYQLPRVSPRGELPLTLLRPLARELARHPDWRIRWIERRTRRRRRHLRAQALHEALAATPRLGVPGSTFIWPLMSQVDERGVAAELLADVVAGVPLDDAIPVVLRAAAWSMLVEPVDHAPYGWTHCLTMPQAVLGIADAVGDDRLVLAVAATYVVGFRAALAQRPLVSVSLPDPERDLPTAIETGPEIAAAAAWNAAPSARRDITRELVTRAALHPDAHYVKYTLACLDAAAADPSQTRLYLAAAAKLAGYWATTEELPTAA